MKASGTLVDGEETPLVEIVSGTVTAVTLLAGFGLLFAGVPYFWVAFPVGFGGVLPVALGLAKHYQRTQNRGARPPGSETETALEELRQRYARGELTDEEFERQVERLLETESVADARTYAERNRHEPSESQGLHRERD